MDRIHNTAVSRVAAYTDAFAREWQRIGGVRGSFSPKSVVRAGLFLFLWIAQQTSSLAQPDSLALQNVQSVSQRLYASLSKSETKSFCPNFILPDSSKDLAFTVTQHEGLRAVRISAAAAQFLDRIAYAMAANRFKKGYLQQYLSTISQYTGSGPFPELPTVPNFPPAKLSEISNDHLSNFNQITAGLLSIILNKPEPAPKESIQDQWLRSLRKGIPISLSCAYGTEGLADFFEVVEKMPTRPDWLAQFFPPGIESRQARKELRRVNDQLLH